MNDQMLVTAAFDRKFVADYKRSERFLVVDLKAPSAVSFQTASQPILNLALVIDASASMEGEQMDSAIKAAIGVVNAISEESRLSVVSFATDVVVHVEGILLDPAGKRKAIGEISGLSTRDNTNLGGGWLTGAECVAQVMSPDGRMHNHVIVISDGHANVGVCAPPLLEHHAQELRKRRILTSSVGIGNYYSSLQLQALADFGGGRLHDAEFPGEIIEVVLGELRELQNTVVEDINVEIKFPSMVRVDTISGFPGTTSDNSLVCQMGSLSPDGERSVIFQVLTPNGLPEGHRFPFSIDCSWIWTGTDKHDSTSCAPLNLTAADGPLNANQKKDLTLARRVAEIWQSNVVRKSVQLNRTGKFDELFKYVDYELTAFSRYCRDVPQVEHLITALERLKAVSDREWDERSRKSMEYTTYLTQTSLIDHRTLERAGWWKFLEQREKEFKK
ncbi:MAG: VWA domain-containing protein [Candidatus Obscuribacterales bacterium]|nr:VWA domain-containing protein [Candidatus Obscuribacterales bacterium]